MKERNLSVVVYCASSREIDKLYFESAYRLGQLLVKNNITCINGAGKQGLMGELNDSILKHGGKVKGVIPKFMVESGWCHDNLTETIVTETIHERKRQMAQLSDAAFALPGGVGTLEELSEIITLKQLGLYNNPVIILNINNYYDPLLIFLEKMIEESFMSSVYRNLIQVASSPEEAIDLFQNRSVQTPIISKYTNQ
mgnify:CR=1 FL=1